jgi:hypothetical protein
MSLECESKYESRFIFHISAFNVSLKTRSLYLPDSSIERPQVSLALDNCELGSTRLMITRSIDDFFGSPTTQYTHTGRHIPDSAFAEMLTFIDTLHDNERLHPQMRTFSQPPWLSTMNYGDYAMNGTIPSGAHTRSAEEGISARVLSALRQRW